MAEINNKRQRRVQRLKRLIVIMLIMVFVIPVTISIVLAVQLHGLGKQVNELQAEIASMQIQLEEQKVNAADSQELTEEEALEKPCEDGTLEAVRIFGGNTKLTLPGLTWQKLFQSQKERKQIFINI